MDSPAPRVSSPARSASPGLSPDELAELANAQQRARKIHRAAKVARFDGTILAFFALMAVFSFCLGWEGPVLGVALGAVAFNSFRCASRLERFDIAAPSLLAMNQLYLAAAIILYALYALHSGLTGTSQLTKSLIGDLDALGADPSLKWLLEGGIYWLLYGGLIVGTILAQGLMGLYYATRRRAVVEYLEQTPQWVIDMQKAIQTTPGFPVIRTPHPAHQNGASRN